MTTKEMIEVMQAYEKGKKIERRHLCTDEQWKDEPIPYWNWVVFEYRVKKEPKYRPYKDTDEMITDWMERFGTYDTKVVMPPIWIWDKDKVEKTLVTGFRRQEVNTTDAIITIVSLLQSYTYLDGTPCGKEVTE